jgi:hypothetical protein
VGPILVLFLLACVVLGAYYASQTVYFVGASDQGFVSVYRGFRDLPAGLQAVLGQLRVRRAGRRAHGGAERTITAHKVRSERRQDLVPSSRRGLARGQRQSRAARAGPGLAAADGGFAAVFIERNDVLSNVSLTYGALFLAVPGGAHRPALHPAPTPIPTSSRCSRSWPAGW